MADTGTQIEIFYILTAKLPSTKNCSHLFLCFMILSRRLTSTDIEELPNLSLLKNRLFSMNGYLVNMAFQVILQEIYFYSEQTFNY